jgi:hypothetical protein
MKYKMMRFDDATVTKVIETWLTLADKIEDEDNRAAFHSFLDSMGERLFSSPASPSVNYAAAHNCMPCGLAEHSIRVYKYFRKLVHEQMDDIGFDHDVTEDDIMIAALFHDMGKIGDPENPYYADQDSDWHKDRGMFYTMNQDIDYMRVQHRSLYLLQHFGFTLPLHVFKAVMLHDGMHDETNKPYSMKEGMFAVLLNQADILAAMKEQKRYEEWLRH